MKNYGGQALCATLLDRDNNDKVLYEVPYHIYRLSEMKHPMIKVRMIVWDLFGAILSKKANIDHIVLFPEIDTQISPSDFNTIIKKIESEYPNTIFCYQSAPLVKDFPEEPTPEQWSIELQRQAMILEYLRFRNINVLCGFENSIAYLYLNETARPIMEDIFFREIEGNYPA